MFPLDTCLSAKTPPYCQTEKGGPAPPVPFDADSVRKWIYEDILNRTERRIRRTSDQMMNVFQARYKDDDGRHQEIPSCDARRADSRTTSSHNVRTRRYQTFRWRRDNRARGMLKLAPVKRPITDVRHVLLLLRNNHTSSWSRRYLFPILRVRRYGHQNQKRHGRCGPRSERITRSPAVAEKADRTAYNALINNRLDNKTLPCSYHENKMITW